MGSSVKDAHLHIGMEDSKTEKPGIWSASFAFGAVRRSTVVDEVCRCHARPAERSGLLARSPREIISTCWSHPSTASAPTSHDVHEGGWTSERLWSIRCTGRLCSHCGWQSDPARSTASQRATLTGRVAPESPMLTVRASLSVSSGTPRSKSRRLTAPNAKSVKIWPRPDFGAAVSARLQNSQNSQTPPAGGVPGR